MLPTGLGCQRDRSSRLTGRCWCQQGPPGKAAAMPPSPDGRQTGRVLAVCFSRRPDLTLPPTAMIRTTSKRFRDTNQVPLKPFKKHTSGNHQKSLRVDTPCRAPRQLSFLFSHDQPTTVCTHNCPGSQEPKALLCVSTCVSPLSPTRRALEEQRHSSQRLWFWPHLTLGIGLKWYIPPSWSPAP